MSLLITENLKIGYKNAVMPHVLLKNIHINLQPGEVICLLGLNGVGKSTLIKTLIGLQAPLEGIIKIKDRNIRDLSKLELARNISIVLTERLAYTSNLTVYDLIALGRHPYTNWLGELTKADHLKIQEAIEFTQIQHLTHRYVKELSDGQMQKAWIARAFAQDTPIVLLDEPTSYLDVMNKWEIMQLLKSIAKKQQKALIISTHELELALQISDKIWLILDQSLHVLNTQENLDILNKYLQKAFPIYNQQK